ncbi:hypothetical protein FANTH_14276 [Fusarium anthophilum]|uniref:Peptidase M3A/M3B catalytic domain-containing protein n=1 Tax=Fusarium anthophilum TaxID=48485 RepID=A0A8H4YJU8_9HYPO|nr:hypothetical protein FANTH_14276 [Fusarium anthophilum]
MKGIINQYHAVREGIIQDVNPQTATFDNVIQPLINIANATQGDIGVIAMLRYASPDQASRQASEEACTLINEDQAAFTARLDFWCLIKAVKEGSDETTLHFEAQKYLNKMFLEFEQFGHATLQPEQIKQYMERRNHIDSMRREYNQRIREDSGGLWFSLDDLAGVPQHDIGRFEKHSENHDMRFVRFSVADSLAVYRSSSKSATRKRMYICDANNLSQNAELFKQIVLERDLNARLLGYESHAAYRLKKRLMKSPGKVEEFLTDIEARLLARGKQDMKSLVELKKQYEAENSVDEGVGCDTMFPWDYWYYARMAQQRRHVNQEYMAEYFPLQHVIKVMLEMFSEFLKIQFCPISPDQLQGSVWHEDVQAWAVWDNGGTSKRQFIGYLYIDLLYRDSKYKGNQNVNLQCLTFLPTELPERGWHTSISSDHLNVFLSTLQPLELYLAKAQPDSLPLPRSPPDFAEALSVMLEKWCWMEPELNRLGLHYTRTDPQLKGKWQLEHPGEELPPAQIPDDMIERLIQGRQVTRSLWFLRQMVYARFDMAVHHPKSHAELLKMDFTKIYYGLMEKLWLVRAPEPEDQGHPHADLGHLVSGYDAGYYSYLRQVTFPGHIEKTLIKNP